MKSNVLLGSLSMRFFETWVATRSDLFSLLTCLHRTTFTLLSIFSPLEMITIKIWNTPLLGCEMFSSGCRLCRKNTCFISLLRRGENQSTQGKTSWSIVENHQTQPADDAKSRNRTWATLMEGECSHHCASPEGDSVYMCNNNRGHHT